MNVELIVQHLGHMTPVETALTAVLGIAPFLVLVLVVAVARRRDADEDEKQGVRQ